MILITNSVVWFVSYCILLWAFVGPYIERLQGTSRSISLFAKIPVYSDTQHHTRQTTVIASYICKSPMVIIRHFAKEPLSVTAVHFYLFAVVVRWVAAKPQAIERTSFCVTSSDTRFLHTPGCKHRYHKIAIRLHLHKCNHKYQYIW